MRNYSFNNNKIYGGPIEQIFGSDDGFALFLNGMGFSVDKSIKNREIHSLRTSEL